ncbi:hypothetical protein R3W88_033127 [Solanum pinnatisectum]|uniref:Retrotransposon gag domain-containing protein n=1 Tax=Solanum pinnatisectum TaxID=50273 RepID=A0AAV9K3L3_9SOLN|nr:hypothetical protein R3W88_033127 [Solanum pinnatisectum]
MVNGQELEAQRQRLGLEAEATARGVQQNSGNNQPRVVDENRGVDRLIPPQRKPIAPRGTAQHPAHMMYDEDDADLDGAGATGAIVLPSLPRGVKFTITNTMIQLLNLKGMFKGVAGDDANQHLMNFMAICKSQIPGINQTAMRLKLFPLSLTGEATNWLNEMPRFSQKLKKCPNHDLNERHLKQAFYRSLNYVAKPVVDAVCGGSFMRKSFAESMQLLDEVSKNNRAWYTRDAKNYTRDGQYDMPSNTDQRNRQNRYGYRNDRSGVYVPSGYRDRAGGSSSGSKQEDMMAKVLQKVESTDTGVKEITASLNYRKNGSLSSDTIQNPKKYGHCIAIASRSDKVLTEPMSAGTKHE